MKESIVKMKDQIKKVCPMCKKLFLVKRSHGYQVCCSHECHGRLLAKNRYGEFGQVACIVCGKIVQRKPSQIAKAKKPTCSLECANQARRTGRHLPVAPYRNQATAICQQCNKEFRVWHRDTANRFCSKRCESAAGYSERECPMCHKIFSAWKSVQRKYCSNQCNLRALFIDAGNTGRRTKYEQIFEQELARCGIRFEPQQPIGKYFADFFLPDQRAIVEVDGVGHAFESHKEYEGIRDRYLRSCGYHVFHFWNSEVVKDASLCVNSVLERCVSRMEMCA